VVVYYEVYIPSIGLVLALATFLKVKAKDLWFYRFNSFGSLEAFLPPLGFKEPLLAALFSDIAAATKLILLLFPY